MNKVTGASFTGSDNKNCSNCGMAKDDRQHGCCHDECRQVKLCDDQQLTPVAAIVKSCFSAEGVVPVTTEQLYRNTGKPRNASQVYPPPGILRQALYIHYCIWRI
jgi:hypothetical protein